MILTVAYKSVDQRHDSVSRLCQSNMKQTPFISTDLRKVNCSISLGGRKVRANIACEVVMGGFSGIVVKL